MKTHDCGWQRRGRASPRLILLGVALVLLAGAAVWFAFRQMAVDSGEQELEITVACVECKHCFDVSYHGLLTLIEEAGRKGLEGAGTSPRSPIGVCPKCGKPTLYRAEKDPRTGEPVFQTFVTRR